MAAALRAAYASVAGRRSRGCVVITGSSAGTGRATARAFGRMGWRVALPARSEASTGFALTRGFGIVGPARSSRAPEGWRIPARIRPAEHPGAFADAGRKDTARMAKAIKDPNFSLDRQHMKDTSFDPGSAALRLASALRTGTSIKALPEEERPATLEEGYAVQAGFVEQLGEGTAGWKLAGASPRGLRGALPSPPATGVLIPSRIFASGALVRLPAGRGATLEVEVSFRFSREVSPADEAFDAASMLAEASLAVEVVCSRYLDRKAVGQPSFVGDNVGFHALVRGDRLGFTAGSSFAGEAGLWREGDRIAASLAGDDRTNPFLSLAFLWDRLGKQRLSIAAGSVVTTGTLTVPVDVTQGGHYEARLGDAKVALTLAH